MTALAAAKKITRLGRPLGDGPHALGVKAATKIWQGAIVVNDAGVMAPGRTATTLIPLGVAADNYDNTNGIAGAITGEAEVGTFGPFVNSAAGDAITAADIGNDCFIVDDATVAKTNGSSTRSRLGKVVHVDADGVYVRIGAGY